MQLGLLVEWIDVMPEIVLGRKLVRKIGELLVGKIYVEALASPWTCRERKNIQPYSRDAFSNRCQDEIADLPTPAMGEGTYFSDVRASIQALSSFSVLVRALLSGLAGSRICSREALWGLPRMRPD
jgi:hypothetical protein